MVERMFKSFLPCYRKASVVVKHSGLDESGESTESEEEGEPLLVGSNGHLDLSRLPKGGRFSGLVPSEVGNPLFAFFLDM